MKVTDVLLQVTRDDDLESSFPSFLRFRTSLAVPIFGQFDVRGDEKTLLFQGASRINGAKFFKLIKGLSDKNPFWIRVRGTLEAECPVSPQDEVDCSNEIVLGEAGMTGTMMPVGLKSWDLILVCSSIEFVPAEDLILG